MMNAKRENKHSILERILAVIGCLLLVIGGVIWIFAGLKLSVVVILCTAVVGLTGPAVVEGGDVLEILTSIIETIVEGFLSLLDALCSVFNF